MDEKKATLLIVEDDLDIAEMLKDYFRVQGYEVVTVNWGEDGVKTCISDQPDAVILDIRLPDIDGFEVAKRLRSDRRTREIPIIFLTEKRQREDRLMGLNLQADDYITKPFDVQELRLRVRNVLQRSQQKSLNNPVTGLPEEKLIKDHLSKCMRHEGWLVLLVSIKNFDHFREVYGFVASDDLLRAVSLMLKDDVKSLAGDTGFLGQINHTVFLITADQSGLSRLKDQIHLHLENSFSFFYRDQDRESKMFQEQALRVEFKEILPAMEKSITPDDLFSELNRYIR